MLLIFGVIASLCKNMGLLWKAKGTLPNPLGILIFGVSVKLLIFLCLQESICHGTATNEYTTNVFIFM